MLTAPRAIRATVLAAALAVTIVACGEDPPDDIVGPPPPRVPLLLTSVSPNQVGSGSSTAIIINGSGFQQGATLTVGGAAVSVAVTSTTSARATVPPHAPGAVDVVMTNPDGERGQLTGGLRYVDLPALLEITGNTTMQAIGATTQLTATATFADGSTRDVTRESRWFSTFTWIATVSAEGLATATGLGLTQISVQYPPTSPSLFRSGQLTVTPAGSYALSGRVREPGGGPLSVARVVHVDSGQSVDSNTSGYFWFGGLTGRPRLRVTRQGYEDSESESTPDEFFDAPLQRVVSLAAGARAYTAQLAPNDVQHRPNDETFCQPCRLIRVTSATPGAARITLRWNGPVTLQIWVDGRAFSAAGGTGEVSADVDLGPGDTLVYIGRVGTSTIEDYIAFNVVVLQ